MKLSRRDVLTLTGLAGLYAVTGWFGLAFSSDAGQGAVMWLPSGIALAAVLLLGYRVWPAILLGSAVLALFVQYTWGELVATSVGSTLSALGGGWMLRHWRGFDLGLSRIRDLLALLLLGGALPAALKASVLLFDPAWAHLGQWLFWWMGDTLGVLLVTPLVLAVRTRLPHPLQGRHLEGWLAMAALALVGVLAFGDWFPFNHRGELPLAFLPAPVLIWIAMRLPLAWTSLAILLIAAISMLGMTLGHGPFVRASATESLVLLWSFVSVNGLLALLLCAGVSQNRRDAEQLRQIVEANPNAILLTDREGRIVQANAQCQRLFGYRPAELLGQPVEMMLPERLRHRHAAYHRQFTKGTEVRPMGARRHLFALRRDGSEFPVEVGLASFDSEEGGAALAVVTDISERIEAEHALQQERNFLSTLLDTTDALMLVLDPNWRIVRFNRACQQASGYTEEEVLGRTFWELGLIPEDELPSVSATAQGTKAGQIHGCWENHWRDRDGELHLIAWSSNFIRDDDGEIQYLIGTGTEITERREAEEELKRWQQRMVRMDRLATAAEMASGLAHELNQPLTAIAGYCDAATMLAKSAPQPNQQLLQVLEQAERQAQRAGSIIRHLRDFVGKAGSDSCQVNLNALIRETVEFVEADIRRAGASVALELAEDLPPLWLDRVQVEQVLVNLLRNASEAMEEAGSERREIKVTTALTSEDRVQVSVRDTGPGVCPSMRAQLFRPFETTKANGLGMGLAIIRSIVEARGGRLWVECPNAGGTVFHFTLAIDNSGSNR